MNSLTQFICSMLALSIGVERIVEILKELIYPLRDDPNQNVSGKLATRRRVTLQILATIAGTITALIIDPHNFISSLPTGEGLGSVARWTSSLLIGLMASGGSAFWNHALDIIAAVKSVKEQRTVHPTLQPSLNSTASSSVLTHTQTGMSALAPITIPTGNRIGP
jgi:hypothetical protein